MEKKIKNTPSLGEKKKYQSPQLKKLGNVQTLTQKTGSQYDSLTMTTYQP